MNKILAILFALAIGTPAMAQSISTSGGCVATVACQASTLSVGGTAIGTNIIVSPGFSVNATGAMIAQAYFSSNQVQASGGSFLGWGGKTTIFSPSDGVIRPTTNAGIQLTVVGLPSCTSGIDGSRSFVTDATATTFASVVTGSGTNHVPVYCDGANTSWKIG